MSKNIASFPSEPGVYVQTASAILYDIGNLLHDISASLAVLCDRSEHDQYYDWDS